MRRSGLALRIQIALLVCSVAVALLVGVQLENARKADLESTGKITVLQTEQLLLRDIQLDTERMIRAGRQALQSSTEHDVRMFHAQFQTNRQSLVSNTNTLREQSSDRVNDDDLQTALSSSTELMEAYDTAIADKHSGNTPSTALEAALLEHEGDTIALMDLLVSRQKTRLDELQAQQWEDTTARHRLLAGSTLVMVLCLAIAFWAFLRWQLIKPLQRLVEAAFGLSEDAHNVTIADDERPDELGALARALVVFKRRRESELALARAAEQDTLEQEALIKRENEQRHSVVETEQRECERQQAVQRAEESAASEGLLQARIDRLLTGVRAAAAGDLGYLAQNPCENLHLNDALALMTRELENLFEQFGRDFGAIRCDAQKVTHSALRLEELGQSIDEDAHLNGEQTRKVLTGAQTVRDVLLTVADRVDHMEAGIRGISDSASQASTVASQAVELARSTDGTMRTLSESSQDIGNVIKLITSVAEQTNLLALNATIEAARAGDAGKGFAVVANEVKELAKETNKATDEIQSRIAAIRNDTDDAVNAIASINQIVSQIDGLQTSISESVRVQSETARGITTLVGDATGDNKTVRAILADLIERQQRSQETALQVRQSSTQLRDSAEDNVRMTDRYEI